MEVGVAPTETAATTIPILSVMKFNGGASVFQVAGGVVRRVPVTVNRIVGERVVVESNGLAAGDRVIYAGMTRVTDGDAVEVR